MPAAASQVWMASTAWPSRHRLRDASRAILGEQPSRNYPCGPETNRRPCDNASRTPATAPERLKAQNAEQAIATRLAQTPALFTGIGRDPHEHRQARQLPHHVARPVNRGPRGGGDRRPGVAVSDVEGRRRLAGSVRRGVSLLRPAPTGPSRQAGRRMMTNPCIRCGAKPGRSRLDVVRDVLADHPEPSPAERRRPHPLTRPLPGPGHAPEALQRPRRGSAQPAGTPCTPRLLSGLSEGLPALVAAPASPHAHRMAA